MDSKPANTSGGDTRLDESCVHVETADGRSVARFGEAHVAYLNLAAKVERRRQEGQALSPVYRVYLRDRAGIVVSGRTIAVENDEVAIKIASILRRACADVCVKFEVWKEEVLVTAGDPADTQSLRAELSRRNQQIVIDTEIALRDSHAALAESRQLLDAIDEWQGQNTQQAAPRRRGQ